MKERIALGLMMVVILMMVKEVIVKSGMKIPNHHKFLISLKTPGVTLPISNPPLYLTRELLIHLMQNNIQGIAKIPK